MKYHFVGVKGSGMSALAVVLKDLGNTVTGSDCDDYIFTQDNLKDKGIEVDSFNSNSLDGIDIVIAGHDFVESSNVEILTAKERKIPIVEYHEFLSDLIKNYYSIAVSGSAGKTTVTGLISKVLDEVEDTSFLIGCGLGKGGNGKFFTFEACEHKEHFLVYEPNVILVNNIEYDHVDYFKSEKDYKNAFYKFINNAKNIVVINGDDKNLENINNVISFGLTSKCLLRAENINYDNGISYDLYYKNNYITNMELNMYGKHMVYNTLACISVCMCLGIDIQKIKQGLKNFNGVNRRFKETIINGDVYIDDYAHHPCKIDAIIDAVKQKYKDREIIAFFRPDRVSRLNYFASEFVSSLKKASEFYVLPFLKNTTMEKDCYKNFLNENNLEELTKEVYSRVSKKKNVVYLMMSSKNMNEVKENILKYKG